ncbi:UvrD-helicase domain-containing protein [Ruegeria profundi]|uniref:DNA 3'-5' helicase n=1 Tax=Ruegeria profundi TaxID=1685378 RepID=A0A0X3TTJ6_9RHOB|nr:UvrD-helicase domain-containing protein [Ruegeria profundi]KUJ77796.1 helicase IV [Ruegeria profundi]
MILNRIKSKPIVGFLLDPLGSHARQLTFEDHELTVGAKHAHRLHLRNLAEAPTVTKGLFGSQLSVHADDNSTYLLKGANHLEAMSFAEVVRAQWLVYNRECFEAEAQGITELLRTIDDLSEPKCYPSACMLSPKLELAKDLDRRLLSKLPSAAIEDAAKSKVEKIQAFIGDARARRNEAILKFEKRQLIEWTEFFNTFESNPLTPEQRTSIVADEDATLVLAGAGSGKTSVITAKAGYLLKSETRKPEEVLLLAFARDAAKEMSERIEEKCGEQLEARTFHSLAYDIIGTVEGSKPALAAHATDDKAFLALVRDILSDLVKTATDVSKAIIGWFAYARLEEKSEWDFNQKHAYYTFIEKADLRTLQGEQVKSFEELMIANWLFENGIEYEYEPNYEHKVSEGGFRDYCPDFKLTKSGVYIEHFGVRRKRAADGTYELTTAPFVDQEEYLESMEWKRGVHEEHKTTLIETYSYERQEGRLLEALAEKVTEYEELAPRSPETLFDRVVELKQADSFVQLVGTFLRHYKGGGYHIRECSEKAEKLKLGKRSKAFLTIFEPVYEEYQRRLNGRIDFEDMILRASEYAESKEFVSPFRHILVDEFQDISRSRGRLVKALKAQHSDARVFAVGDDWQSIYRFAGSDINLMRHFGEEFGGVFDGETGVHRTVDLGRTFRSVDQIAHAAKRFVLKNPAQLTKIVIPAGVAEAPALRVVSTFRHDADLKLTQVLGSIPQNLDGEKKTTVLLLGRYRHLAPAGLTGLRRAFPQLDITFKTIHSSKGLEADHVIVLNLFRGRTGFPSEIVDDPLLNMVSPDAEPFENAEERRVMYVALTRARKTVTLMSSASMQSAFVTELLEDPEYGILGEPEFQQENHICGECGGQLLAFPTKDGRFWYRCEHADLCGFSISACSSCGKGFPTRVEGSKLKKCTCGAEYPSCPACENGWLVERNGRYGSFLGCISFPRCKGKMKAMPATLHAKEL